MTDTPEPLTPPDCDLRGMEWMPLFGARLFSSNFDAHATDAEFRVAMRLWWACWQQVPAGSLPDDDAVLCNLAGLGRNLKQWRKMRSTALHGFVTCSDGRLYHQLQATQAKEAWERRVKERERKAIWRGKTRGPDGGGSGYVPRDRAGTGWGRNAEHDGDVRVDRTRQDKTLKDSSFVEEGKRVPPEPPSISPELTGVVLDATKALKMRAYGPGVRPQRTADEQRDAVTPTRPKAMHLTREQINASLRRKA